MSVDLSCRYLGLKLANPLVAAASPLTADVTTLQRLEAAGVAAIVTPSLFEEQIEEQAAQLGLTRQSARNGPPSGLPPLIDGYNTGADGLLRHIELARRSINVPVIGSLNACSRGGWVRFAELIEQAGADALELNVLLIPTDPATTPRQVEDRYVEIVQAVCERVQIPVAVKIGPYFAAVPNFAVRLADAGAAGLVLFNRFLEPEFNLERMAVEPHVELSRPSEVRLALRWIAILYQRVALSLAATGGVHCGEAIVKAVLAGADAALVASALLQNGPGYVEEMLDEVRHWLERRNFDSLQRLQGLLSYANYSDPDAFGRANYMQALATFCENAD